MEIKQFKKLEIFGNAYQIEYGTQYQIDHHKYGKIKKHYHTTTTHTIQNKTLDNLIKTNNPINKDATIKEIKLDQFNKTITITRHNEIKINKETFQTKEEITIKPKHRNAQTISTNNKYMPRSYRKPHTTKGKQCTIKIE